MLVTCPPCPARLGSAAQATCPSSLREHGLLAKSGGVWTLTFDLQSFIFLSVIIIIINNPTFSHHGLFCMLTAFSPLFRPACCTIASACVRLSRVYYCICVFVCASVFMYMFPFTCICLCMCVSLLVFVCLSYCVCICVCVCSRGEAVQQSQSQGEECVMEEKGTVEGGEKEGEGEQINGVEEEEEQEEEPDRSESCERSHSSPNTTELLMFLGTFLGTILE